MSQWCLKMDPQSLNFLADKKRFRLQPLISTGFAKSFCTKTNFDNSAVPYKSITLTESMEQDMFSSKTGFAVPAVLHKNITLNQSMDQGSFITKAKLLDFVSAFQRADSSNHIRECTRKFNIQSESYKKLSPYEQLTTMSLASTYLVGGFVGSKSQVGGTSRGGFGVQIWDIILDKFVELMGSAVDSNSSYYEEFFEVLNGEVPSDQHLECVTKQTEHVTNCKPSEKKYTPIETVHSKQSYADVTKTVAHHTPVVDVSVSNTKHCVPVVKSINLSIQQKNKNKSEMWQQNINRKERRRPSSHMHSRNASHSHQKQSKGSHKMNWKDRQETRDLGLEYTMHGSKQFRNNKYLYGNTKVRNENKKNNEYCNPKCRMNSCELEIVDHKVDGEPKKWTLETLHMKCEEDKCVSSIVNLLKSENFSPDLEIADKNCPMIRVGLNFSLSPPENKSEKERSSKMEDVNERCRYLSECSVDSDDSFVVFDAGSYSDTEFVEFAVNDEDCNESDSGEEEDDSIWIDDNNPLEEDDVVSKTLI